MLHPGFFSVEIADFQKYVYYNTGKAQREQFFAKQVHFHNCFRRLTRCFLLCHKLWPSAVPTACAYFWASSCAFRIWSALS